MKAYQATGVEGGVELAEVAAPEPQPDQIVIDVDAFSVNRGELNQLRAANAGWRPGWDVAGTVRQAASDGSGPGVGSRVVGWVPGGAWASEVAARVDDVALLPDGVDLARAAALPVAGITAHRTLAIGGADLAGKRVFITGGAGGVGSFATVLAVAGGAAEVHVSAQGAERAAYVRALGADVVVDSIADGVGDYDLILESAGGPFLAEAMRRVAPGGTVVTFGNSSRSVTSLNIVDFYRRTRASVTAFALVAPQEAVGFSGDLAALVAAAATGTFDHIRVTSRDWNDVPAALDELEGRAVLGKSVALVG